MKDTLKVETSIEPLKIRILDRSELNADIIGAWRDLEERSDEKNAYLSPSFVLPASKYLTSEKGLLFVFVERCRHDNPKLLGFGAFKLAGATRSIPFPHLQAYRPPHSFLSGFLIDKLSLKQTCEAFFKWFCSPGNPGCAVEFINLCHESETAKQLHLAAADFNVPWFEYGKKRRAQLVLQRGEKCDLQNCISTKRKKNYRRCMRLLKNAGEVKWRILDGDCIDKFSIDRFLLLENMGWKGKKYTSLISKHSHRKFFYEMIENFSRKKRSFFTELLLNNEVIASTSNLISGNAGFAFKVGWHPAFSKMSPGILNEIEFLNNVQEALPEIAYIDSGAEEGSFIDALWPDRRVLVSGYFATKPFAMRIFPGIEYVRRIKRKLRKMLIKTDSV